MNVLQNNYLRNSQPLQSANAAVPQSLYSWNKLVPHTHIQLPQYKLLYGSLWGRTSAVWGGLIPAWICNATQAR